MPTRSIDLNGPGTLQIIVAWQSNKWVVLNNTRPVGSYAYRTHATDAAAMLVAEALAQGADCYMLVRDKEGAWSEQPCPKPPRTQSA